MLRSKATFGLFVYGLMGLGLHRSYGHYHPYFVPFVVVGLAVLVGWALARPEPDLALPQGRLEVLLALLVLAFGAMLAYEPLIRFANGPRWAVNTLLHAGEAALVPLVAGAAGLAWLVRRGEAALERRPLTLLFAAVGLVLLANQVVVTLASPAPQVDVYRHSALAADYLLQGQNPYLGRYPEIYAGAYGGSDQNVYPYWPGCVVLFALGRALFGEVRLVLVAFQAASAAALYLLGRRLGLPLVTRVLFPLAWLAFPAQYFVIEQSWVDTFLTTCVLVCLACLHSRRWVAAALVAGLAASVKQYGLALPFAATLWLWRWGSLREAARFAGVAALAFFAVTVPFFATAPEAFVSSTVTGPTHIPFRPDSFTLAAYLFNEWELSLSVRALTVLAGLGALAGLATLFARRLSGWGVFQVAFALLASFSALFLLGRHAYCNYVHFLSFLVLLFVLHASAPPLPAATPPPPST